MGRAPARSSSRRRWTPTGERSSVAAAPRRRRPGRGCRATACAGESTPARSSSRQRGRAAVRRWVGGGPVRRAAPLIYAGLALALAGPLLMGRGVVLAVDLSQSPHPGLDTAYWGLPQGTHEGSLSRLPLDALFVAL